MSIKLRSVCDICTSSKVKCDGNAPCGRCQRKGLECHYRPFRHQKKPTPKTLQDQLVRDLASTAPPCPTHADADAPTAGLYFFEEYERKTWSVFFSLYRKLVKGGDQANCSSLWYNAKLSDMHSFLQSRADPQTLERFNTWVHALGITLVPQSHPPIRQLPGTVFFPELASSLELEAQAKNLPMIKISPSGQVTCNAAVRERFGCEASEFQHILDESGGGFLPYGADVIARLVCRERDLVTYIQIVSLNIDSVGKPPSLPSTRAIPTQCFVHVQAKQPGTGRFASCPCIVRSVYLEQIESMWAKSFYYTMVFDIAAPLGPVSPAPAEATEVAMEVLVSPRGEEMLPYADEFTLDVDQRETKRLQLFDDDLLDDSEWLDTLLLDDKDGGCGDDL